MWVSIDEFVKAKVLPQYQGIVQMLRDMMHEEVPGVQEIMYRGVPAFKRKSVLAVISPTKAGITFSLAHGATMEDKYGLLEGPSKTSKTLKLKSIDAVSKEALKYYIEQALELDK
jgi:hypothetical protein